MNNTVKLEVEESEARMISGVVGHTPNQSSMLALSTRW